jgi:hypothetical protein
MKDMPVLKDVKEFTSLVGVLCIKREKKEDMGDEDLQFLLLDKKDCSDDSVVRIKFLGKR